MKNILLVIDIQRGFITNGHTNDAKERICRLIGGRFFDEIIVTRYENYENSPIIRLMGWDSLLNESDRSIVGNEIAEVKNIVTKTKYSGYGDSLLDMLRQKNNGETPEQVFLCGVDTECCVLSTATDLFEAGIRPVVLSYYCGSSGGEEYHHAGILSLHHLIGRNNIYDGEITEKSQIANAIERAKDIEINKKRGADYNSAAVVKKLIDRKMTISFAESCTGGMAAAKLVDIPDASKVFNASLITYANEAKIEYLGVSPDDIAQYGVVSEQVAGQMAVGTARKNHADVGVGISGIAGPTGGTDKKPVGMVCFGFYIDGEIFTTTKFFGNLGRNEVRRQSVEFVYETLKEKL